MQGQAFKSIGMWLIMWFWRLGCSCALLEHLCIANFVDKLWDYLVFSSYIGWAYLIILTLFTQIHYTEVRLPEAESSKTPVRLLILYFLPLNSYSNG